MIHDVGLNRYRGKPPHRSSSLRVHITAVFAPSSGAFKRFTFHDRGRLQLLRRLALCTPVPVDGSRVPALGPSGHRTRHIRIQISGFNEILKAQPQSQYSTDVVLLYHQGKIGEALKMKHEKELKPVSLRVRDAAELLLTSLVEKVGNFPSPCGAHSTSCLLDEGSLLHQSPRANKQSWGNDVENAVKHFRYFATSEGTILLSVLEQPLGNDQGT